MSQRFAHLYRLLLVALLTTGGVAATALSQEEGLILHKKTESSGFMGQGGESTTSTLYFGPNAIRQTQAEGEDFIIDVANRTLTTLNKDKETYSVLSFDELQAQLDEASRKLEEAGAENQQAMEMMKKMMGGDSSGEVRVEKLGPGPEIAGFATQQYLVDAGFLKMNLWTTPELEFPTAYYDMMKLRTPPNPMFDMGKMFDAMKQVEGVSLKTVTNIKVMGREITSTDEVTKAERGPMPAELFEVPEGYREVPFGQ